VAARRQRLLVVARREPRLRRVRVLVQRGAAGTPGPRGGRPGVLVVDEDYAIIRGADFASAVVVWKEVLLGFSTLICDFGTLPTCLPQFY
jgi:hypothetical protein